MRSKEQTWKEEELKQSLQEINDERNSGKSRRNRYDDSSKENKESSQRRKRGDDEDRRIKDDRHKEHDRDSRDKSDRHRERGSEKNIEDRNKRREREHKEGRSGREDDHRDSEKRRRDEKEKRTGDDRERRHREEGGRDRKHRDGDGHRERDRDDREKKHRDDDRERKHRDDDKKDPDRRNREDRDKRRTEHEERERKYKDDKERSHRDGDDREKRHRDDADRERRRGDGDRERKQRDDKDRESRHREDGDRERRHRDDDKEKRHRDDGDRERRNKDDGERDRRHRDGGDKEGRHRDEGDRERKRREDDDRERRHRGDDREDKHRDGDRDRKSKDEDRERKRRDDNEKESELKHKNNRDSKYREGVDRDKRHRDSKERDNREDRDIEDGVENRKQREHLSGNDRRDDESGQPKKSRNHKKALDEEENSRRGSGKATNGHQRTKEEEEEISFEPKEAIKPSATELEEEGGDDYGGYDDDDFEDYDDDFEDDDGGEETEKFNKMHPRRGKSSNNDMEELFDALNAENERLLADSRRSDWSDATEGSDDKPISHGRPVTSKPRGFINFVAAKQRDMNQKAASKARKRCTELLNIIELDTVHMTLFDLPPVKEYDLYMSSFGRTNAQQVYIQTNDDNLERDTQTEDIDTTSKWTQHPAEGATVCGQLDKDGNSEQDSANNSKHDDGKLSSFLQRACQVIERLINEEHAKSSYKERTSKFSCSEAHTNLSNVGIFGSRRVSSCRFSPTDSSMLLTIHTEPFQMVDKRLDTFGLIGIWNTNDPSQPQKIVASASMPTCCCFSPIKATLVFGGMRDGSVVAWDLREPPTMHHSYICGGQDWLLRFPTYNTAGVLKYDNHSSPVTALVPILTDNTRSNSQESGVGLSFQLASLERNGVVNLWVVAEILETSMAGSESDLGLSPNGKIKLLKSSSIPLIGPSRNSFGQSLCTLDLKLNPSNHNHFYVATDGGVVLHGTRFGTQKTIPRCYKCDDSTPCVITTVDLHPYGHPVLLAGCEDGSIRLHHLSSESPTVVWESSTNGAAIKRVLWSRNCAYIIFVLDSNSVIHMWDLLRNDAEPMTSDQLSETNKRVVDISLSEEEQSNSRPKMVLNYDDGTVQVHLLSSHVSNLQPGENEQFSRFVEQL